MSFCRGKRVKMQGVWRMGREFLREVHFLGQPCRNRPAEFARTSLSAWGLPTPVAALACICDIVIQILPPLKREGDQRSWWRDFPVKCSFWGSHVETVRRNSLVPRCPPGTCQRRLLPLPVSVVLIFKRFLVQAGDFYFYGVCKFICLSSFVYK